MLWLQKKIITKKTTNDINLNTKKLVQDEILDVNFDNGKKANVIVYIVDKKGLSTALKSAFGKQLKAEIESQKAIFEIQQQEKMENIKE